LVFVNYGTLTQGIRFRFSGFGCQNVAAMGFVIYKFATARGFEPFCSGTVCFDFWHCFSPYMKKRHDITFRIGRKNAF